MPGLEGGIQAFSTSIGTLPHMDRKKTKSLSKDHKSNTPEEQEGVITRLLDEVRGLHAQLQNVRNEVSKADVDFDLMSVVGGIKRLAKERKEFHEEVHRLNKELNKMIKQSR